MVAEVKEEVSEDILDEIMEERMVQVILQVVAITKHAMNIYVDDVITCYYVIASKLRFTRKWQRRKFGKCRCHISNSRRLKKLKMNKSSRN